MKKIANFLIYSNLWIALCAVAMLWQTEWILFQDIFWDALARFVFFSTLFLYAIHRLTGVKKLDSTLFNLRFQTIRAFNSHILFYALISLVGTIYYFFQFNFSFQIKLFIPSILSLGYVIPFLKGKKRLRDLNYVKIGLISVVWAWVTVVLPVFYYHLDFTTPIIYMILAEALFIFAITLPFDIRDLDIDKSQNVATIPLTYGLEFTKKLGYISLILLGGLYFLLFRVGLFQLNQFLGMILFIGFIAYLIQASHKNRHDYFFSFLVDGTMILGFWVVYLL